MYLCAELPPLVGSTSERQRGPGVSVCVLRKKPTVERWLDDGGHGVKWCIVPLCCRSQREYVHAKVLVRGWM